MKPYRDFTFERYDVTPGNRDAVEFAKQFDRFKDNLYLWGLWGVGKTHLAMALLRRCFARGASSAVVTPARLVRKLRMKTPDEEQQAVDHFIRMDVLLIDDLGVGGDSPYARQVLQEILDGRDFNDRGGLVVTSQHSIKALARRLTDGAIPSRLAGMCRVIGITGPDRRLQEGGHRAAR